MNERKNYLREVDYAFKTYVAPFLQIKSEDYVIVQYSTTACNDKFCLDAKINKDNDYKILTKINKSTITKIAQAVWKPLLNICIFIEDNSMSNVSQYKDALYESAFVWGVSQWLGGGKKLEGKTIYKIIRQFMSWSMKTYEGNRVRFGVVIDIDKINETPNSTSKINVIDFLEHDSSASISDGVDTYFIVASNGEILRVSDNEVSINENKQALSPYELEKVCKASDKSNVGICLSSSGDIYCFKQKQLKIARLNGKWVGFSYEAFNEALIEDVKEELIKEIYKTCLDVSFARTGGCLAICNPTNAKNENLDDIMPTIDVVQNKFPLIKDIHNNNFFSLPRLLRKEYMAIDGATIIDFTGKVHRIGAIINSVKPGSDGGGRKAATKKLSEFGIAIKISADGYIQIIKNTETIKEFK